MSINVYAEAHSIHTLYPAPTMKVVCLKSIRRRRSPYERMPYYPRSHERYVVRLLDMYAHFRKFMYQDEPLWDTIHLPIVPYRPWVMLANDEGRQVRHMCIPPLLALTSEQPSVARTQPAQDVSSAYQDTPQSVSSFSSPDVQVEQVCRARTYPVPS